MLKRKCVIECLANQECLANATPTVNRHKLGVFRFERIQQLGPLFLATNHIKPPFRLNYTINNKIPPTLEKLSLILRELIVIFAQYKNRLSLSNLFCKISPHNKFYSRNRLCRRPLHCFPSMLQEPFVVIGITTNSTATSRFVASDGTATRRCRPGGKACCGTVPRPVPFQYQ